jgi:2-iminobutanoate/2-iminopropanoate deaminase
MMRRNLSALDAPTATGGYSQAVEVSGTERTLYVSGQVPIETDAQCPPLFGEQCRLVWAHIEAQLRAADMSLDNLVKVTTFLSDRCHARENSEIRQEVLGGRAPALTVIIAGIYDEAWLLEIEALAVA